MLLGIDRLLRDKKLRKPLQGKRLALLGHPASMTGCFEHTLDALMACPDLKFTSVFGPQHGMRGDKQDNMVESEDYLDPIHQIPVFSLYGKVRRPTGPMLETFDILLVDVQDIGTRIYTFLTTVLYVLEAGAKKQKSIWILDRPNPAGRPIEGSLLKPGWESFVGAGPLPMRHGLTPGESALWFKNHFKLNVDLNVIAMEDYDPNVGHGYGWPVGELPWVNPSPNAASLNMARCYPGTVLLEGTNLSEGRGTTRPLEMMGAPDLDMRTILTTMHELAPGWLEGCGLRVCHFQPTFHKHADQLCEGLQIHTEDKHYRHDLFKPYRLVALWLRAIRINYPEYKIWRDFYYEYEKDRLAIDLINGSPILREWVDDPKFSVADFESILKSDELVWEQSRREFLLY